MAHRETETRTTTTDFFERALGIRTWLLQICGASKSVFLPQGLLDFFGLAAEPAAPAAGRVRLYFLGVEIAIKLPDGSAFFLWRQETVRELSANATASFLDWIIGTGSFTITLPNITSKDIGRPVRITNVGLGAITVDGDGADTIGDGISLTAIVIPGASLLLMARSTTDWLVT